MYPYSFVSYTTLISQVHRAFSLQISLPSSLLKASSRLLFVLFLSLGRVSIFLWGAWTGSEVADIIWAYEHGPICSDQLLFSEGQTDNHCKTQILYMDDLARLVSLCDLRNYLIIQSMYLLCFCFHENCKYRFNQIWCIFIILFLFFLFYQICICPPSHLPMQPPLIVEYCPRTVFEPGAKDGRIIQTGRYHTRHN